MSEKPKKREAASWQAQVGFYLSLVLAVFQVYQYFHSERETQIAASIDVARKYFSDPDFNKGRNIAAKVMRGTPFSAFSETEASSWNQFSLNASYIAELLNKERLDEAYLTDPIICDIWLVDEAAKHLPSYNADAIIHKVSSKHEAHCKTTFH